MPLLLVVYTEFCFTTNTWSKVVTKQDHVTGVSKCKSSGDENLPNDSSRMKTLIGLARNFSQNGHRASAAGTVLKEQKRLL